MIFTPSITFAQGAVVFWDYVGRVEQWTTIYDSTPAPVPVGGGYVALVGAPKGTPLVHPLGVYEGSSGFLPGFSSLEGFLAANPGWAVPNGGLASIITAPGFFNGGTVTIDNIGEVADADYVIIGWTGPYASYDAAYAADLANPNSSFLGMSAIATTHTGDQVWIHPEPAVDLRGTFQGMALAPVVILEPITVSPAWQAGDYTYATNNGTITITGYTGSGGAVTIPDEIGGIAVTSIGVEAFYNRISVGSVTIPNSVTNIGAWAFLQCASLTSVAIPDSVINIGGGAFYGCKSLASVTIPASVTSIGDSAFSDCTSLTSITVDPLNPAYSSLSGVLFNSSLATLIQYPSAGAASYAVPNSVNSIGQDAFWGCASLTNVTIPISVNRIGDGGFGSCTGLTSITIPVTSIGKAAFSQCASLISVTIANSVTNIGGGTFSGCSRLTNLMIPNRVTAIADSAFSSCTNLAGVTIPDGVTSIGDSAFSQCTSLTSVPIPNRVSSIGDRAFSYCTSLTNVTIPSTATNIGDFAFARCTSMTAITVDALNPAYSSLDGVLYDKGQTTLLQCPGGKAGGYAIPNTVTTIQYSAFDGCARLTDVAIPNSVTSIRDSAFGGCASLANITIPDSVIHIGNGAFAACSSATNATIGRGVIDIGTSAFAYCYSLTTVTIGQSLTSLGDMAFWYCTSLIGVYFSGNSPPIVGGGSIFVFDFKATIYHLPGTTDWGPDYQQIPTALWVLPYPVILTTAPSFGIQNGSFGFIISWAKGYNVVVEASTGLANPTWSLVETKTLTPGGWAYFSDPGYRTYPARFFRIHPL